MEDVAALRDALARAEARAADAEQRLQHVLDTLPVVLGAVGSDRRWEFVRGGWLTKIGVTPETIVGKPYGTATPTAVFRDSTRHPHATADLVDRVFAGEVVRGTLELLGYIHEYVLSPRRSTAGEVTGMYVTSYDLTEERRLQEQLQQAQKVEAIGQLAGGIAHDFNNLLTVIQGCSALLEVELQKRAPDLLPDLSDIRTASERAADLTHHLLAFARKQVVSPIALDLNTVLLSRERMLRRVLGASITLEVRLTASCPAHVDPTQLELVIINLVVNARDAMSEGGHLLIETRHGRPEHAAPVEEPSEGWVRILVTDTGIGLSPDVKRRIFEPFFTTKGIGHGTGLGLAAVQGIMAQSGGLIGVASVPGHGTTFELSFPRTTLPLIAVSESRDAVTSTGHESILVVEDDPHVRAITVRTLREAGYTVMVAGSGAEAIALPDPMLVRAHLLVTDVVMPDLDGIVVADSLRKRHPELRVLYVSGHADNFAEHRASLPPKSEFLAKPFTPSLLLGRVRTALET